MVTNQKNPSLFPEWASENKATDLQKCWIGHSMVSGYMYTFCADLERLSFHKITQQEEAGKRCHAFRSPVQKQCPLELLLLAPFIND